MDKPTAPRLMRLYVRIRDYMTPEHTMRYLLGENVMFSVVLFGIMLLVVESTLIESVGVSALALLITVYRYLKIVPERSNSPRHVMRYSMRDLIILTMLIGTPVLTYTAFFNSSRELVGVLLIMLYVGTLNVRSQKYLKKERDFYTNSRSNVNDKWVDASIYFETALRKWDSGNTYESYYWSTRATDKYEEIVREENRHSLREGANNLLAATELLAAAVFTPNSGESYSYYRAAKETIERANNCFAHRYCDYCGRRTPTAECRATELDDAFRITCNDCRARKNKSNAPNQRVNTDEQMSIAEALQILGLDSNGGVDEETIRNAFRRRVKDAHPDTGGNEEEFKKVKNARERLL